MDNNEILNSLKGGLVVSCQALEGEPLYTETGGIMPKFALAAKQAGAIGIRANSVRDILEIKETVDLPVIGIIKRDYPPYKPFITATLKEIDELVAAGADIIATDYTFRERPEFKNVIEFIRVIKKKYPNQLFMADVSTLEEGISAYENGVDIVATTLSGYTSNSTLEEGPNFKLVEELSKHIDVPIIAEGRIHFPEQARIMIDLGAHAVVVGGAITRPHEIAKRFVEVLQ